MFLCPQYLACPGQGTALLGALGGRESLTSIVLLLRIFDVGGELGEDINAGCVRFPVFRSQSGVPGMDNAV